MTSKKRVLTQISVLILKFAKLESDRIQHYSK